MIWLILVLNYLWKSREGLKGTYDFYGINYYSSSLVKKAADGEEIGPWPLSGVPEFGALKLFHPDWRPTGNDQMKVYAEGLRKQLVWLKENYGDIEFMITENGCPTRGKNLNDLDRIKYIEEHLEQILLAIKEDGINVRAYTAWTLMDGFEWVDGYSVAFGLYEVDFEDRNRTRTARASARYYANVIKNHSLDFKQNKNQYVTDEL